MGIKRDYYLEQIRLWEKNGMIKVITEVRRCGKSYLLFKLFMKESLDRGIQEDHMPEKFIRKTNMLSIGSQKMNGFG